MSADLVSATVRARTQLDMGFLEHASHQAMTALLADWESAHARLGRQADALRKARDARRAEKEAGLWPNAGGGTP